MNEDISRFNNIPTVDSIEKNIDNTESLEKMSFDEQYDHPEEITTLSGERFKLHDATPPNGNGEAPIFFCPGWLEDPVNGKENLRKWYEAGRQVLWPDSPHGIDIKNIRDYISFDMLLEQGIPEELLSDMPMTEMKKAAAVLISLDSKNILQTDAVGQSEGGIYLCVAALLAPERFKNIVLVNSGGLIGKDLGVALAYRSNKDTKKMFKDQQESPSEFFFKDDPDRGKMYFNETLVDTIEEGYGISQVDLRKILEILKMKGVDVSIVHTENDLFFPVEKVKNTLADRHHDGITVVENLPHQGFILEPTKFSKIVNDELHRLEANRQEKIKMGELIDDGKSIVYDATKGLEGDGDRIEEETLL